ncbi:Glutathione S-transferase [Orchesella cincta]|uniref:Glutathione S-transferase n=1 Tax=Orchesella cincta TaxID=48709 RepID=A0A1D2M4I1_ORCCI|nr:Glutathione S-transferase [Orchesella cincta]
MATAKLYYFDARGVGEPIRLILTYGDYEAALCDRYVMQAEICTMVNLESIETYVPAIKLEDPQEREKAIEEGVYNYEETFMDVYEAALKQSPTGKNISLETP